jgi:hypothetical protein
MDLTALDNALWAASLIGHVALVIVLVTKKRIRLFPVFTAFAAYAASRSILLFFVLRNGSKEAYFLAYWITGLGDYIFQVALLFEIARDVLRPTGTWVLDARKSFLGWGSAGLVASALIALQIGPPQAQGLDLWDVRITVFTSLLTCELFVAVAAVANRLGLQWRSHAVAISQGIALWAFVSLLEEFGHVVFGWDRQFVVLVHVRMFAYLAVLVYWIGAFWLPEKARAPLSPDMSAYLLALRERVQYDVRSSGPPS